MPVVRGIGLKRHDDGVDFARTYENERRTGAALILPRRQKPSGVLILVSGTQIDQTFKNCDRDYDGVGGMEPRRATTLFKLFVAEITG